MDDTIDALRTLPLCHDLSDDQIADLASEARVDEFERSDYLWRAQTPAVRFFFIVEGWIKLLTWTDEETRFAVGLFGCGDGVGHAAAFGGVRRATEAVALDDVRALSISRSSFLTFLEADSGVDVACLRGAFNREFRLCQRLCLLSVASAERRLALLFYELAYNHGRRRTVAGRNAIDIPVALTRTDLGELINTRTETAIRKISSWQKEDVLATREDGFLIYDLDYIEEIASPTVFLRPDM
ncbi:MAG: Crp/Fnr family transcriptional regulator [Bradymonadaceae bacterium]